jgi:hypothetical protein
VDVGNVLGGLGQTVAALLVGSGDSLGDGQISAISSTSDSIQDVGQLILVDLESLLGL